MKLAKDWKRVIKRTAAAGVAVAITATAIKFTRPELHSEEADALPLPAPVAVDSSTKAEASPALLDVDVVNYGHKVSEKAEKVIQYCADQTHLKLFQDNEYPSAKQCAECHPQHYREWSVSGHAYAQLSPIFNCMSNALQILTNGTNSDFCIRCHTPVGMERNEPITMSNLDRHPASREGVTCIACHRINKNYGKGGGRRKLVAGELTEPIYGPLGNEVLLEVLANPDEYGVFESYPDPATRGREVHRDVEPFFAMTTPAFCGSCHDVFAPNGFRLEDLFSEYKASPAAVEGTTCQDCHMGKVPGKNGGYACEPIARVGNKWTRPRKRTNHMMAGPDYSIIHPGLFPHNIEAIKEEGEGELATGLATMREWLQFDGVKGWGDDKFESAVPEGYEFPEAWKDQNKRIRAHRIIQDQYKLLNEYRGEATKVLQAGYKMDQIQDIHCDEDGLHFRVRVSNGTNGHGTPVGFDAERLVYLHTMVWDSNGKVIFQSGDLDPNGDVRDAHSFYVHNGVLPTDHQLFNLQSKFITRNVRGGEREQILPINVSPDPLPFLRPNTRPLNVLGRPLGARKHKQNLEVGGERWAEYHVKSKYLTGCDPYYAKVTMKAGMVPVNLVHRISIAGFDYGLDAKEVGRRVVEGQYILHERSAQLTD